MKRILIAVMTMLYAMPSFAADVSLLIARAKNGDDAAAAELGQYYYVEKKNPKSAEKWLKQAADAGIPDAQYQLARVYDASREGKHPNKEVVAILEKASSAGQTDAQVYLGRIYEFGRKGIARDVRRAEVLYSLAAAKGSNEAMRRLEAIYQASKDGYVKAVQADDDVAWLDKSVEQGNAEAALRLAEMSLRGEKVPKNAKRAAELYQIAADAGSVQAQSELGALYAEGEGVAQNNEKAVELLTAAAKQGYVEAQRKLANLYAMTLKQLPEAYAWQVISLSAMFPNASNLADVSPDLERLLRAMTQEQIKQGQQIASNLVLIIKKNKKIQEEKQMHQIKMMENYQREFRN